MVRGRARFHHAGSDARPAHVPEARPRPGSAGTRHLQRRRRHVAARPRTPHRRRDPEPTVTWLNPRMGRAAVACALAFAVTALPAHAARRAKAVAAPPPPDPAVVGASLALP